MKIYVLAMLLSISLVSVKAQQKTIAFNVDGLKVIFRPTQKETVSMSMYYRGGVLNYDPSQAGLENLALSAAATCGTKNYSVTDYEELADEYGIEISGESGKDYGTLSMDCIYRYFDQGWKLFSDAVVHPAFDAAEFQKTRDKTITQIYSSMSDPETRVEQLSDGAMFNGLVYGLDPVGTVASVKNITADSVKKYYHQELLNKERMFLVVAGRMTREELEAKIRASLADLPAKPYTAPVYEQKLLEGERLLTEQRDLATNYMSCILNAPVRSSKDYYAFMIGVDALASGLHYEIRTRQGLSYAPGATVKMQQLPYTSMYVSTTQPKKVHDAIIAVYQRVRTASFNPVFLDEVKKNHRNQYYRHQESSASIVKDLGEAEVLGGYELEDTKVAGYNKVTLPEINQALNKYLKGAIWIYVGDEALGKAAFK